MKRKIVLISCATVMLAVMVTAAFLKHGELVKSLYGGRTPSGYSEHNDYADDVAADDKDGEEGTYTYEPRTDDGNLKVYNIGEDVICGVYGEGGLESEDKEVLSYRVNSVERVSRITNIPDKDKNGLYLVEEEGTPVDGYELVAVDITIKNDSDKEVEYYLNSTGISEKISLLSEFECEAVYCSDYPGNIKSAFRRTISPGDEYSTKIVYAIEKEMLETAKNELYYIINPGGSGSDTTGAAAIRITLEGEPHEADI